MVELFANSGDPDQTPRSSASNLGLHCLPITLLGDFRLQWVNQFAYQEEIKSNVYMYMINSFGAKLQTTVVVCFSFFFFFVFNIINKLSSRLYVK